MGANIGGDKGRPLGRPIPAGFGFPSDPEFIRGALDAPAALIEHMRIDHRRAHILVAEQFLDRSDIIAVLQ